MVLDMRNAYGDAWKTLSQMVSLCMVGISIVLDPFSPISTIRLLAFLLSLLLTKMNCH